MITGKDILCMACTMAVTYFVLSAICGKTEKEQTIILVSVILSGLSTWAGRHDFFVAEKKD